MIELFNKTDITKINNKEIQDYLNYSFNRLPSHYEYPQYGYFTVIENYNELENKIHFSNHSLPPITDDEFFEKYIELYEIKDNVLEIVLLLDNDFGISLIMDKSILPQDIISKIIK